MKQPPRRLPAALAQEVLVVTERAAGGAAPHDAVAPGDGVGDARVGRLHVRRALAPAAVAPLVLHVAQTELETEID